MRQKKNEDIRKYAFGKRVYLSEVAEQLGIAYPTVMYWLRTDLSAEKRSRILEAIDILAAQK